MAHRRLSNAGREASLDTCALVHESYLRFAQAGDLKVQDRAHFFRYASRVMRSVVVDFARARLSERRGGDALHVTLDTLLQERIGDGAGEAEILCIHEALGDLAKLDERLVHIVEMRYFAGFTEREIAESLAGRDRAHGAARLGEGTVAAGARAGPSRARETRVLSTAVMIAWGI